MVIVTIGDKEFKYLTGTAFDCRDGFVIVKKPGANNVNIHVAAHKNWDIVEVVDPD